MKTGSRRLIQGSPFALMIFSRYIFGTQLCLGSYGFLGLITLMASLEIWRPVEESEWRALSSMGTQWMVKSFASNQGYMAMVTDGCALWGENRDAKYIHKQAEVWAPCVEGGIKELSSLVLEELTRLNVKVLWMGNRESLTLSISSELHDLSYKWQFELKRLSDELNVSSRALLPLTELGQGAATAHDNVSGLFNNLLVDPDLRPQRSQLDSTAVQSSLGYTHAGADPAVGFKSEATHCRGKTQTEAVGGTSPGHQSISPKLQDQY
ncbi:uncharacterized protein [Procambarus clarkii]|uniref:uncharacterized protein isoform X5 n=1 Tax=Procambarus clarkii TaxID=6728 RepID=UPI00374231D9